MKLDLTIIIVSYKTGNLVRECVESIKEDTANFSKPKTEVILIDNDSPENGLEDFPPSENVKVVLNMENIGFAKAVNQGIERKKGEYVLLLNPDSKVKKGAITALFEFAKNTPDAGVVGAKLINTDESTQDSVMHFPTVTRAIQEFWLGKKVYSKYLPSGTDPLVVDAVVGAAFLITPKAIKKVGMLNKKYFMYFEDLEYCKKVWDAGLKVYYLPSAEIIHHHGVSGRSIARESDQWRRLIPSSKIYHGLLGYYLIYIVTRLGQKLNIFSKK